MKKLLPFLLIFSFFCTIAAQAIHGKVLNDAGQNLSGVSIYLDGTKIRTVSQEDGTFSLSVSVGPESLVFRKENYETIATICLCNGW